MKKIIAVIIAALTISATAITATVPASASNGYYLTTADTFLSLRTGPDTSYTEIDRLGIYTSVRVDHYEGNWAYVYVPARGEYGYVYSGYLTPDNDILTSGTNNNSTTKTCCVNSGYLALRTYPSYNDANEIGAIYAGQKVQVEWYTDNGYAYVYAPTLGCYGYVNAGYIY